MRQIRQDFYIHPKEFSKVFEENLILVTISFFNGTKVPRGIQSKFLSTRLSVWQIRQDFYIQSKEISKVSEGNLILVFVIYLIGTKVPRGKQSKFLSLH